MAGNNNYNSPQGDSRVVLALRYAVFALISMGLNLGAQRLTFYLYQGPFDIYVGLVIGTTIGLASKYLLDKKFIFAFTAVSILHDLKTFLLYTAMGVVTTIIFWGTELLFDTLFDHQMAKYIGGAIGLAVGYTAKYFLDKRFVFSKRSGSPDT